MAATRFIPFGLTGQTVYVVLWDRAAGQAWNGAALETYAVANWGNYAISAPETPASGYRYLYTATANLPGDVGAEKAYDLAAYQRSGATAAVGDHPPIYTETVWWDGSDLLSESEYQKRVIDNLLEDVAAIQAVNFVFGSSGSTAYRYRVKDDDETTPLAACEVWLSSDVGGAERSESRVSDDLGWVTFQLDPPTAAEITANPDVAKVYVWRQKGGKRFTNPQLLTLEAVG